MSDSKWINHDIHRSQHKEKKEPELKSVKKRKVKPYPTYERVRELFILDGDILKRKKPHHKEREDRVAGGMIRGFRYILVDGRNCKVDRLIEIYKGLSND